MQTQDPMIRIRGLSKTYSTGLFKKGFRAIDGIDLEVGRGSVFGLLGPNGAGKTTLIKILLGLVGGWEGEAEVFGLRAGSTDIRRRIGYLPEAHRLPGYLTGLQALHLYGLYSGRSSEWMKERTHHWVERVGMAGSAQRKIREYSKGMQQRIGLAMALAHEPELIFLDEPTDGVDPVGRAQIREIVSELKGTGATIFINSHLLMEVEQICDQVVVMARGRIIREGTIAELTPHTGRVKIELTEARDGIEQLLTGIGSDLSVNEKVLEVSTDDEGQNVAIDRLRQAGIGIRSIAPRKLTLEESFIDMIAEDDQ